MLRKRDRASKLECMCPVREAKKENEFIENKTYVDIAERQMRESGSHCHCNNRDGAHVTDYHEGDLALCCP